MQPMISSRRGAKQSPPVHAGGPSTEAALPVLAPSAALDRPFALPKRQSVSSDASARNAGNGEKGEYRCPVGDARGGAPWARDLTAPPPSRGPANEAAVPA